MKNLHLLPPTLSAVSCTFSLLPTQPGATCSRITIFIFAFGTIQGRECALAQLMIFPTQKLAELGTQRLELDCILVRPSELRSLRPSEFWIGVEAMRSISKFAWSGDGWYISECGTRRRRRGKPRMKERGRLRAVEVAATTNYHPDIGGLSRL